MPPRRAVPIKVKLPHQLSANFVEAIATCICCENSEELQAIWVSKGSFSTLDFLNIEWVILTSQRLVKIRHGQRVHDIPRHKITHVTHRSLGIFKWDQMVITLINSKNKVNVGNIIPIRSYAPCGYLFHHYVSDVYILGVYDTASCQYFVSQLRNHPVNLTAEEQEKHMEGSRSDIPVKPTLEASAAIPQREGALNSPCENSNHARVELTCGHTREGDSSNPSIPEDRSLPAAISPPVLPPCSRDRSELKILSLNTALISFLGVEASYLNPRLAVNEQRAAALAQHCMSQDCDVMCLQEVFDNKCVKILLKACESIYPFAMTPHKASLHKMTSGLLILSKYPVLAQDARVFTQGVGDERFASKGFAVVVIQPPQLHPVVVYNTHLHAGIGIAGKLAKKHLGTEFKGERHPKVVRDSQFREMAAHVGSWSNSRAVLRLTQGRTARIFMCGDFNTKLHSPLDASGLVLGQLKYPGQAALFEMLPYRPPANFFDLHAALAQRSSQSDEAKDRELVVPEGLRCGTLWKKPRANKCIDAIVTGPLGAEEAFTVMIESSAGHSDHHCLLSTYTGPVVSYHYSSESSKKTEHES